MNRLFQSLKGISGNWDISCLLNPRLTPSAFQSLKGISGNWDGHLPWDLLRRRALFQSLKGISGNWDLKDAKREELLKLVSIPKRD